jgi:hypothetical protein
MGKRGTAWFEDPAYFMHGYMGKSEKLSLQYSLHASDNDF